ncbi:hypothetical protein NECAME_07250 [Necator americanus]|uniref:Uncharacterized protein n=1 Tax=Necator americanus TaxID=51031 RepID=W2TPK6_NECAM|nr:hypothetical protein NECAME_07250 [Necator americanus]ETN83708.1 hypothetical protein NECAME_07250 [Necator americanus]
MDYTIDERTVRRTELKRDRDKHTATGRGVKELKELPEIDLLWAIVVTIHSHSVLHRLNISMVGSKP